MFKRILSGAFWALLLGVLVVCALALLAGSWLSEAPVMQEVWRFRTVQGGSMEPAIHAGSLAVIEPVDPTEIEVGDAITFTLGPVVDNGEGWVATHRVVEVLDEGGSLRFRTKGDANASIDPDLVSSPNVAGRVRFSIPYLGYLVMYMSTRSGIALFLVLPALVIIVTEIVKIRRTIGSNRQKAGPSVGTPDGIAS